MAAPSNQPPQQQLIDPNKVRWDQRNAAGYQNRDISRRNYEHGLDGGGFSGDSYERAQQERNYHQTDNFKKYYDPLDPGSALADTLGTTAYKNRTGLLDQENESADLIKQQGGKALGQGTKKIREGANSRGLLYSGMRQGAEGDLRGKVANAMAGQIQQSNSDLMKRADSMDQIATQAKLQGAQKSMESQLMIDQITQQNAVARAQQMQQLAGAVGYGFGSYLGGKYSKQEQPATPPPGTSSPY